MELSLTVQALALAIALLLGLGIGLLYDLFRPPRYRLPPWLGGILDCLFTFLSGAAIFIYAMTAPNGRLGVWELMLTFLGFLLYMYTLSPYIYKILENIYVSFGKIFRCTKEKAKNIVKILKKLFPNAKECFKIEK